MTEARSDIVAPDPLGRALYAISRVFAVIGGVLFCAAGLLTVVSVLGRYLFSAPVEGDFEIVEMVAAISVFGFLPYCQMVGGNVIVDFFTAGLRPAIRCALDAAGALIFAAIAVLLGWRLTVGGMELYATGEETVVLEIPRYLSFYPIVVSMALLALVALYTAWRSLRQATGALPDWRETGW